jgi:predicted aminopeptidase
MGKGAVVLALGGLESVLSGCATTLPRVSQSKLASYHNSITSSVEDPHDYLRFLNEDEYIVPDDVFDAYVRTIDKRPKWISNPIGGYLSKNYIDTNAEKKEFINRLKKLGLNEDEVAIYSTLLTNSDVIIFRASVLKDKSFEKVIAHERFHKKMKILNDEDYRYMMDVANELLERRDDNGLSFVRERYNSKYRGGFAVMFADLNHEEFYTYLAQGEFIPEVEKTLRTDFPKAYEIFDRIRDECRLK